MSRSEVRTSGPSGVSRFAVDARCGELRDERGLRLRVRVLDVFICAGFDAFACGERPNFNATYFELARAVRDVSRFEVLVDE